MKKVKKVRNVPGCVVMAKTAAYDWWIHAVYTKSRYSKPRIDASLEAENIRTREGWRVKVIPCTVHTEMAVELCHE